MLTMPAAHTRRGCRRQEEPLLCVVLTISAFSPPKAFNFWSARGMTVTPLFWLSVSKD